MQHLEFSCAVRSLYGLLGSKRLGVRETLLNKAFWPKRKEITVGWEKCIKV